MRDGLLLGLAWRAPAVATLLAVGCYAGEPSQDAETSASTTANAVTESGNTDTGDEPTGGDTDDTGETPVKLQPQPLHRLNRLEYNNTVRDLLGTSLRPADVFGPDPEANGFDNMAEQLHVSGTLVEAYDKATRDVIADALDDTPAFRANFTGEALAVPGGYPVGDLWALSGHTLSVQVTVPALTQAEIVLHAGASVGGGAPAPEARLRVNGVALPIFPVQGTAAIPHVHVQPIALAAGTHTIEVTPTNHVNMAAENIFNNVFVAALAVRSTELVRGPGHARVFVCEPTGPDDKTCYAQVLGNFAARAWRRPLVSAEATELATLWEQLQVQGESVDAALRLVMRGIMLSPKFFYRARTTGDADSNGWLDTYVLASRLSYFLWSSMPDDRLFAMAKDGTLASDKGLSEAVAFMLADPKAEALLDGFAEQWLSVRHLAGYNPSPDVYPSFDEPLRAAMTAESRLFFADFLTNNLPAAAIIHPNFAYRNDRLASHYGLPPVNSDAMLRVPASGADRRGLLALGAWLTATSEAEHSSPIRRGRWVSERLLCNPIPPPPAGLMFDVPDFAEAESVREALELHRADPTCAGCHQLLDVLGMGFEDFDGVAQSVADPNVDNLGELPDGRTFHGAGELSQLYANSDTFVECFARNLFTYAAGRPAVGTDIVYLRSFAGIAVSEGYDLPQLIDAIVHAPGFRSPGPIDPQ